MTIEEAYKILCEFQMWRRYEGKYAWGEPLICTPKEIGIALDVAIETLKKEVEK